MISTHTVDKTFRSSTTYTVWENFFFKQIFFRENVTFMKFLLKNVRWERISCFSHCAYYFSQLELDYNVTVYYFHEILRISFVTFNFKNCLKFSNFILLSLQNKVTFWVKRFSKILLNFRKRSNPILRFALFSQIWGRRW